MAKRSLWSDEADKSDQLFLQLRLSKSNLYSFRNRRNEGYIDKIYLVYPVFVMFQAIANPSSVFNNYNALNNVYLYNTN